MSDRTIWVSRLPNGTAKEDLQIYFQSRRRSDGGDIEDIIYDPDTGIAKIVFADSLGKI